MTPRRSLRERLADRVDLRLSLYQIQSCPRWLDDRARCALPRACRTPLLRCEGAVSLLESFPVLCSGMGLRRRRLIAGGSLSAISSSCTFFFMNVRGDSRRDESVCCLRHESGALLVSRSALDTPLTCTSPIDPGPHRKVLHHEDSTDLTTCSIQPAPDALCLSPPRRCTAARLEWLLER